MLTKTQTQTEVELCNVHYALCIIIMDERRSMFTGIISRSLRRSGQCDRD